MTEPFERIGMDNVGPLPYVLVVCDYATRYPEAVESMDAKVIAEELVKIFSRVGILKEILTGHWTNFTSKFCPKYVNFYMLRHPYNLQTNGLMERFNQTLKVMLRKTA